MFHSIFRPALVAGALLFTPTAASARFDPEMAGEPYRLHYGAEVTLRLLCAAEFGEHRPSTEDLSLCRDRLLVVDFEEFGYSGVLCFQPESPSGSVAEAIVNYVAVNSSEWPTPALNASLDALRRKYPCR